MNKFNAMEANVHCMALPAKWRGVSREERTPDYRIAFNVLETEEETMSARQAIMESGGKGSKYEQFKIDMTFLFLKLFEVKV